MYLWFHCMNLIANGAYLHVVPSFELEKCHSGLGLLSLCYELKDLRN